MKRMRIILLLAFALALVFCFTACTDVGGGTDCTEHVDANGDGKCDNCTVDVSDGGENGGGENGGGENGDGDTVYLVKDGKAVYSVVVDGDEYKNARGEWTTFKAKLKKLGIDLEIKNDVDHKVTDKEILVGSIDYRDDKYKYDFHKLGPKGSAVQLIEGKIIIAGGTEDTLIDASRKFIEDVFVVTKNDDGSIKDVTVPADYFYEKYQDPDSFRWSSILIDGIDADEYVIAVDTVYNIDSEFVYLKAAEAIQNTVYTYSGKWMDILSTTKSGVNIPESKVINIYYDIDVKDDGGFKVTIKDGIVNIATCFPNRIIEAVNTYVSRHLVLQKGEATLTGAKNNETQEYRYIYYKDYEAKGDGRTDDFHAIRNAHLYANRFGHTVRADSGATYYIGTECGSATIPIMTDTEWGGATFIIDDRYVECNSPAYNASVFTIKSDNQFITLRPGDEIFDAIVEGGGFKQDTTKINYAPGKTLMMIPYDTTHKVYIRYGGNANDGNDQHEVIIINPDGTLDKDTPVLLDYNNISYIRVLDVSDDPILITGGNIVTYANTCDHFAYHYFARNITVSRSNVIIRGVKHSIKEETDVGSCYSGFFNISNCNNIRLEDVEVQAHRMYMEVRGTDKEGNVTEWGTSMGTYEIGGGNANGLYFYNCIQSNFFAYGSDTVQSNDWYDENGNPGKCNNGSKATVWGVMGTNYCKNITYDSCRLNRLDAHAGVYNATIINSDVSMINLIGGGTFLIKDSTVYNYSSMITLRSDYGSTWDGELILEDVVWNAKGGSAYQLVSGSWVNHHFGYETYIPKVTIRGLTVENASNSDTLYVFSTYSLNSGEDPRYPTMTHAGKPNTVNKNILNLPGEGGVVLESRTTCNRTIKVAPDNSLFADVITIVYETDK